MLISEVIDPTLQTFQAWADQIKTQYGLHQFDLWLDRQGDIKLNSLIVPKKDQRTGLGTATMLALCRMADQMGKRIILSPATRDDNWGTTSQKRLISFYKRFGFVQNKGRKKDFTLSDGMYREPNLDR
jgi:GNAT superfamily N-acetyltransferase